jgi:hypothetical protein
MPLLYSCHAAPALARSGARINSSCRPGEIQRDADDRCSSSHQRRPDHHPFALHTARGRPSAPAQTTQTRITRSAAAQNHGLRSTGQVGLCSEDFLDACVDFERLTIDVPANPRSRARRTTRNVNKVFRSQASLRDFSERMGFSYSVTPATPEF